MIRGPFLKVVPDNFVPLSRTPWGGRRIADLKRDSLSQEGWTFPDRVGESWEISTDAQFPSVLNPKGSRGRAEAHVTLQNAFEHAPVELLGHRIATRFGAHSPLLLKWLHAQEVLSVQLHPRNENPLLGPTECGKPESWLVLDVEPGGYVYLGFQEGVTQSEALALLRRGEMDRCLHRVDPKPFDYISVPPGCVHAVGPGILLAEPQFVLPGKAGKTWRLWDWARLYDEAGNQSPRGKPRELHLDMGLEAIDWTLPHGNALETRLVRSLAQRTLARATPDNPFPVQVIKDGGTHLIPPLVPHQFSLFTVWEGQALLAQENGQGEPVDLRAGESCFVGASAGTVTVTLSPRSSTPPAAAFFALDLDALGLS